MAAGTHRLDKRHGGAFAGARMDAAYQFRRRLIAVQQREEFADAVAPHHKVKPPTVFQKVVGGGDDIFQSAAGAVHRGGNRLFRARPAALRLVVGRVHHDTVKALGRGDFFIFADVGGDKFRLQAVQRGVFFRERYEVRLGSESATRELTRELCEVYDAIMCMTEDECSEIIRRWPDMEDRVMCLGETDMRPPRLDTQGGWNRAADAVAAEISGLTQELLGGDEQDD